jgi:hypothetical protein
MRKGQRRPACTWPKNQNPSWLNVSRKGTDSEQLPRKPLQAAKAWNPITQKRHQSTEHPISSFLLPTAVWMAAANTRL